MPLLDHLPPSPASDDALLDGFLAGVSARGLELYPAQEEAVLELAAGKNVILSTPTGSGKSLVAEALHFFGLGKGERSFYTCPIKALASEKFFALSRELGPENVGLMTGDATVNAGASVICCTAEILANLALRDGPDADVDHVVMDEFHYYADRERGVAWQIPLLELSRARFLLMSATLGPTEFFEETLTKLTGLETAVVRGMHRPVPLDFTYRDSPLHETVADLVASGKTPIYIVGFTQRACAEEAQNLMSVDFSSKEEKKAIAEALLGVRFDSPYGKDLQRFLRHGIGLHHAGLLPKYRLAVEKLAQRGRLKIICGTDTLGVGVNVPIRTVLFTKLCKFDGEKTAILSVRDFQQISGRAGRKGFDDAGSVVVQAPEHVIENLRLEAKAGNDPVKKKRIVKKKPPERGYVHWDKTTFDRLTTAAPEPLVSRFQVSHAMILNVLQREGGGCMALGRLIGRSHERTVDKRRHGRTALAMFKSLQAADIVRIESVDGKKRVVLHGDLQREFSLNQTLALWLLDTIPYLDRESPTFHLDVLSLVEAILESPDLILMKQLDRLKTEKMAEMKAAGIEYDERIAELEKLEHPKPNAELIYDTFNAFAKEHPWATADNVRPKSIARDMVERFATFAEYVREYDLERAEGLLLRYLSDVYKVLVQTVPDGDKTAEVDELVVFFGAIVRQVDSSLLDEWERMRRGDDAAHASTEPSGPSEPEGSKDVTRDERGFTVLVRNELFALVRAIARRDWESAAAVARGDWTPPKLEAALGPLLTTHGPPRTDPEARAPQHLRLEHGEWSWDFVQTLLDADGPTEWALEGTVDLEGSRLEAKPILVLKRIAGLSTPDQPL